MLKRREITFSFEYALPEAPEITPDNPWGRSTFGPQEMTLPDGTVFVTVMVQTKLVSLYFPHEAISFHSNQQLPAHGIVIVHLDWPQRIVARSRLTTRVSLTVLDAEGLIAYAGAHASHPDSIVTTHLDEAADRMTILMSDPSWLA